MDSPFGIIAGNGVYPQAMARSARAAGVRRIVVAAFQNETDPKLAELVDEIEWMRVGQMSKLLSFFEKRGVQSAVMAGQIDPKNLFDLRPDIKALMILARLKQRNAESIFSAIGDELQKVGVNLISAITYMEDYLAKPGLIAGPALDERTQEDVQYGFQIAKETSRLDIGQTVVVKNGTVLAVEAFEGTNSAMRRGGELGKKNAVMVKVSKPNQDFRFDVPVIGRITMETAHEAKIRAIGIEAGKTLLLEKEAIQECAQRFKISVYGHTYE